MQHINKIKSFDTTAVVTSANGARINLDMTAIATLQIKHGAQAANAAFASSTDIDATANTFTKTAHGLVTGTLGQFSTSTTLPTGLSTSTDYYAIKIDANTLEFATSYANAVAGTAIDISTTGTGTQTFTLTTKSGSLQVKVSNEDDPSSDLSTTEWVNKGSATTISGSAASVMTEYDWKECGYKWMALAYTHTAGQFSFRTILNMKG